MNATSAVDIKTWSLKVEWVNSSGTTTSDDSSILSSSRCTPRPVTSLVVPAPANTALFWPEAILSNSSRHTMPMAANRGLSSAACKKAGENRARILADVASFRIGGDVDDDGGQVQDLLEQQLDQKGLAAPGGSDEQGVGLGQQVLALDPVDVDALDAANVAVGHERNRPARFVLATIAQLLQPAVDLTRRQHGKFLGEPDHLLETGPPRLLELFHRRQRLA
jgi:hypothetical protein